MTSLRTLAAALASFAMLAGSGAVMAQPPPIDPAQAATPPGPQRSKEEIQLVFDRSNAAFAAMHKHAQLQNPALGYGNLIIRYSIAPNGAVTDCEVVSSPFNDPAFERRIVQRVMMMQFGARQVPAFTVEHYALRFHDPEDAAPGPLMPPQSPQAQRTIEDIQLTFDRNRSSFAAIHRRAFFENPDIPFGTVFIRFTIEPDGSVSNCEVVSSELNTPAFERKLTERVRLMNFGPRNIPAFTVASYPIRFHDTSQ